MKANLNHHYLMCILNVLFIVMTALLIFFSAKGFSEIIKEQSASVIIYHLTLMAIIIHHLMSEMFKFANSLVGLYREGAKRNHRQARLAGDRK